MLVWASEQLLSLSALHILGPTTPRGGAADLELVQESRSGPVGQLKQNPLPAVVLPDITLGVGNICTRTNG